jgi:hypothetical protein
LINRYYNSRIGRFISEDFIHSGLNWYVYCHNDPINFSDPLGLAEKLRKLVEETTGSVNWVGEDNWFGLLGTKNTATVKIDGTTQKYIVKDGNVYVNDKYVGYIENDSIMVEESDFNRDFKITGTVTIYNYYNEDEADTMGSFGFITGHSWIGYSTMGGSNVTVSTGYQEYMDSNFTASTWNGGEEGVLNRSWDQLHMSDSNTINYSKKITQNQQSKMLKYINSKSHSKWSYGRPCTNYAVNVFFKATGIALGNPNETMTPQMLKSYISLQK